MSAKRKATEAPAAVEKKARSITSFFGQPTRVTSSAPKSATKFNKDDWVKSLTSEQKELLQLEIDTLDPSWLAELKDVVLTSSFLELKRFLRSEKANGVKIFPKENDIYSWSRHTPLNTVKVVILGQDPYHNDNQAHGLSFSVQPPTRAPPSLLNMWQSLKQDFPSFIPPPNNGGCLLPWADRGVLMLNACLTVKAHTANSHQNKGWEPFTQKVVDLVSQKQTKGVVFMAWGANAAKRMSKVDKSKHCVLQSVHPSPLSAHKGPVTFFDAHNFKKANEWLSTRYDDEGIDWNSVNPSNPTPLTKPKAASPVKPAPEKKKAEVPTKKIEPVVKAVEDEGVDDDEEAALREVEAAHPEDEPALNITKDIEATIDENATNGTGANDDPTAEDKLDGPDDDKIDWAAAEKVMEEEEKKVDK